MVLNFLLKNPFYDVNSMGHFNNTSEILETIMLTLFTGKVAKLSRRYVCPAIIADSGRVDYLIILVVTLYSIYFYLSIFHSVVGNTITVTYYS